MDEKTAWRIFCSTGKIDDYMRYSQIKQSAENCVNAHNIPKDKADADKNGRNSY